MVEEIERRDDQGVADRAGEDEPGDLRERHDLDGELLFAVALGFALAHEILRDVGPTAVGDERRVRLDLAQIGELPGAVAGLLEELAAGGGLRIVLLGELHHAAGDLEGRRADPVAPLADEQDALAGQQCDDVHPGRRVEGERLTGRDDRGGGDLDLLSALGTLGSLGSLSHQRLAAQGEQAMAEESLAVGDAPAPHAARISGDAEMRRCAAADIRIPASAGSGER